MPCLVTRAITVAAVLVASLATACDDSIQEFNRPVQAVLTGSVTDGDGGPVPGTRIEVEMVFLADRSGGCDAVPGWFAEGTSGAGGTFELLLDGPVMFSVHEGCLDVIATPPEGSGLEPDTVRGLQAEFRAGLPLDTIAVELVLSPG